MHYQSLAISDPAELIFGQAPKPVTTRSGMVIGGGTVYPELNFTLPPMAIDAGTMKEVRRNYEQIITGALRRAATRRGRELAFAGRNRRRVAKLTYGRTHLMHISWKDQLGEPPMKGAVPPGRIRDRNC